MKRFIVHPSILALTAALTLPACQDDWNEHYDQQVDTPYGTMSLYEAIAAQPELSDFCAVLDSVRIFANNKPTSVHYREMLSTDQFFTVWAPVNGSFDRDSLLRLASTQHGDSLVDLHFLQNHIARFAHNMNGRTEIVPMLNRKTLAQGDGTFATAQVMRDNIGTRNGLLHIVDSHVDYYYNIYEALVSLDKYNHLGDYYLSYQIEEFDEENSLAMGVVDGKTVYVDSVFTVSNMLTRAYGYVDREDSTYWMIVPTRELWDGLYAEAETYYNYGAVLKADSIRNFWAHYALMQDLVYNPRIQKGIRDSITSTQWYPALPGEPAYHVYYTPFAEGGLFNPATFSDSLTCSNGSIYEVSTWPFEQQKTYFIPIKTEAEGRIYEDFETTTKQLRIERRFLTADSVSDGYVSITPQTIYDAYYVTYELFNVLSGTYDVQVVMLPKTVYNPNYKPDTDRRQFLPCKFTAELTYAGTDGKEYTLTSANRYVIDEENPAYYVRTTDTSVPFLFNCNDNPSTSSTRAFTSNPYCVDTITLATVHFPTCSYGQPRTSTRLKLVNSIRNNQTNQYSAEWLIDCFILRPHKED